MTSPDSPDDRAIPPAPAYGEYASPEDAANAVRSSWPAPSSAPEPTRAPVPAVVTAAQPRDRWLSIALLAFGLYMVITTVSGLAAIETQFQGLYTSYGLGTYVAPPTLASAKAVGIASQVLIYVAVLALTIRRIRRGQRSFWIPLVGGVLATAVVIIVIAAVVAADSTLIDALKPPTR